ncbi:hypothetical protein EVAR_60414_1 [Eumeta japonica]|uniref:Uncharacterized protein n=1 Tax=Eumeta variegata TaxID=151549 RepID=A0A4C1ZJY3_EUMVA|nr:hypothetical protein EVAR_60414_1 [Eumeta japonica]
MPDRRGNTGGATAGRGGARRAFVANGGRTFALRRENGRNPFGQEVYRRGSIVFTESVVCQNETVRRDPDELLRPGRSSSTSTANRSGRGCE